MADRILIVKLSSLGDLFHALPAVHVLKVSWGASIDWLTQPEYAELAGHFEDVDEVICFPRRHFLGRLGDFRRTLRRKHYDYAIDMQGLFKSGLAARMADADRCIGPSFNREASRVFYHAVAGRPDRSRHAVDQHFDLVKYFGLEGEKHFPVAWPKIDLPEAPLRIGIAPCSRWTAKNWPIDRFAELANRIGASHPATFYLLGGPGDVPAGRHLAESIQVPVDDRCGKTSLPELGGLIRELDLVVSNDSGPMHIASTTNTPVLALFGPTDPALTGPYGDHHHVIRPAGLPRGNGVYKSDDTSLIEQISVDEVYASAVQYLSPGA
jgi:ADP-heptose:LPS heptosyltransferase